MSARLAAGAPVVSAVVISERWSPSARASRAAAWADAPPASVATTRQGPLSYENGTLGYAAGPDGSPYVGLTGAALQDPEALADGFRTATQIAAAVAAGGAVLTFTAIRSDVLESRGPERHLTHCAVAGTPLRQTR